MAVFIPSISNTRGSLFQYINKVNQLPILTREEEVKYAELKDQGDIQAAKMLVSSHLRLVVKIAYSYKNYGLSMFDLISEGNIGLIRAVKGFKLEKGCRLATYAMWWIKAYIHEYVLKSWSLVKIGTTLAQKKLFFNLQKIKNKILKYSSKALNNSDIKYIANQCGVREKDVLEMNKRLCNKDLSLNAKVSHKDEQTEVIDLLQSDQVGQDVIVIENQDRNRKLNLLKSSLKVLNERERAIICSRRLTEKPVKLKDLAKKFNISSERVRQIESKAIEKIKEFIKRRSC